MEDIWKIKIPLPSLESLIKTNVTEDFMEDGREYLFGETTAKITWGMIAQNHADRTKWIPVSFIE